MLMALLLAGERNDRRIRVIGFISLGHGSARWLGSPGAACFQRLVRPLRNTQNAESDKRWYWVVAGVAHDKCGAR
jgi:hypothetical protein